MTLDDSDRVDAAGVGGGTPDRLESGFHALFAVEVTEEVLSAVDLAGLLAEEPVDRVVDLEELATAVGRPTGRLLGQRLVRNAIGGGVAGVVGREIAGRAGGALVRAALEEADPATARAALATVGLADRDRRGGEPVSIPVTDGETGRRGEPSDRTGTGPDVTRIEVRDAEATPNEEQVAGDERDHTLEEDRPDGTGPDHGRSGSRETSDGSDRSGDESDGSGPPDDADER